MDEIPYPRYTLCVEFKVPIIPQDMWALFLNRIPLIEWHMGRACTYEHSLKKNTCHDEIGLCAQNTYIILS